MKSSLRNPIILTRGRLVNLEKWKYISQHDVMSPDETYLHFSHIVIVGGSGEAVTRFIHAKLYVVEGGTAVCCNLIEFKAASV